MALPSSLKFTLAYALCIQFVLQVDSYLDLGFEIGLDKPLVKVITAGFAFLLSMASLFSKDVPASTAGAKEVKASVPQKKKNSKLEGNNTNGEADVVVVGCGIPKRGMGWYHLTQLLDMPKVNVRGVVEPFFMNSKLCPTQPTTFADLVSSLADDGVPCVDDVTKLPSFEGKTTICLIAGRTADNPKLFRSCIDHGAKVIYLEKPGAPTVQELQEMSDYAKSKGVKVYLGYNKNVTPYVQKALELSKTMDDAHITFCHNNSYNVNDLNECFSRNSEGMMKNMAIHELALLVTFFGVTTDTISELKINKNKLFTQKLTVWVPGTTVPNEKYISDFSRVGFKATTKSGKSVSVMADRCGGNVSFASVKDKKGMEVQKFEFPDEDAQKKLEEQCAADPDMMPYFFVQSDDYLTLKNLVVEAAINETSAEGVATIDIGVEALKLAEYCTEQLNLAFSG